jgi:hypothetical protein
MPPPVTLLVPVIDALVQQFPDQPPYGGAFAEVVPHLAVAQLGET